MLKESLFYGKVLLFGEYGIIQDSMGLSIPYDSYQGSLIFHSENKEMADWSNKELMKFYEFLNALELKNELPCKLDLKRLYKDIKKGMLFDSSIPKGYGVGSSGALVASIYSSYAIKGISSDGNVSNASILKLKKIFSELEAYFHGKSSGLDPLICYLNLPILIKSKNDLNAIGIPAQGNSKGGIFLLNTGNPGETQPMVNIFLDKLKEEGFRKMLKKKFKKYNDACIEAFLEKDFSPLFSNMKNLSKIVLENFKPMIPSNYQKIWEEGIESNAYYLKLCGSGGGGFILGFTENIDEAKRKLSGYDVDVIYNF
ncbi:MAG: mevalonate kinase [Flavobacteriales bacterium]|nr:mevalonate kinase [Flavobacteriales bacterium]